MSNKRKDSKGRVLRKGESERKDGIYMYRYTDLDGSRKTIYLFMVLTRTQTNHLGQHPQSRIAIFILMMLR